MMTTSQTIFTIPQIKNSQFVEHESTGLLDKGICSMCSCRFCEENKEHAVVAVSETTKDRRNDSRLYFCFYHLVCKRCFEKLDDEEKDVEFDDNDNSVKVPSWSLIEDYVEYRKYRPSGMATLDDPDAVEDLLKFVNHNTNSWEDFDYISWTDYSDYLPSPEQ